MHSLENLLLAELNQPGEVKGGLVQAATHKLEAAFFSSFHDPVFSQGVGTRRFAGSGKELANSFS